MIVLEKLNFALYITPDCYGRFQLLANRQTPWSYREKRWWYLKPMKYWDLKDDGISNLWNLEITLVQWLQKTAVYSRSSSLVSNTSSYLRRWTPSQHGPAKLEPLTPGLWLWITAATQFLATSQTMLFCTLCVSSAAPSRHANHGYCKLCTPYM